MPDSLLDQTGTGHQKSLAKKAKPVLKRAYARTKTGARSKTGSARTSTGILLIRVLTCIHYCSLRHVSFSLISVTTINCVKSLHKTRLTEMSYSLSRRDEFPATTALVVSGWLKAKRRCKFNMQQGSATHR